MKERDYINATNVVKIRIAKDVIASTLPMAPEDGLCVQECARLLRAWEERLEKVVTP